jgi:hypothetical protein
VNGAAAYDRTGTRKRGRATRGTGATNVQDSDSALLEVALDGRVSVLLRFRNFLWAVPSPDGRLLAIGEVTGTKNVWEIENFQMIPSFRTSLKTSASVQKNQRLVNAEE